MERKAKPVTELQAERLIFVRKAKFLGRWPNLGHLIGVARPTLKVR